MEEKTVNVPNISCGHCTATIEQEVGELEGIIEVKGDAQSKNVTIRYELPVTWERIAALLDQIGYPAKT